MNPAGKLTPNCAVLPAGRAPVGAVGVRPSVRSVKRTRGVRAFSLFEMVIVVGLMGLLAALALPSMKLGKGSQMSAATRQLLDDLVNARLRAITHRGEVYVVFATNEGNRLTGRAASPNPKLYSINQGPKLPKKPSAPVQTPTMSEWK